jgi:hypothetical protein
MNGDDTISDHVPITALVAEGMYGLPRQKCCSLRGQIHFNYRRVAAFGADVRIVIDARRELYLGE